MSKRKKKNQSPNIPQATIEPAQETVEQAGNRIVEDVNEAAEEVSDTLDDVEEVTAKALNATPLTPPVRRVRAVRSAPAQMRPANNRNNINVPKKDPKTDSAYIRNRLANPTRFVTEAELKVEYGYVTNDLRMTGVLAGALIVLLFILERIL